jgi:hypothetical protein
VDLVETPFILGPELACGNHRKRFVEPNVPARNQYLKCSYRNGFVVPEQV